MIFLVAALSIVVPLAVLINLRRLIMSKTVELTAAVDAAVAKLQAPVTPDTEVQTQIDRLDAAVNPPVQP